MPAIFLAIKVSANSKCSWYGPLHLNILYVDGLVRSHTTALISLSMFGYISLKGNIKKKLEPSRLVSLRNLRHPRPIQMIVPSPGCSPPQGGMLDFESFRNFGAITSGKDLFRFSQKRKRDFTALVQK